MSEKKTYSETEADQLFAAKFHGMTWNLLDKSDRKTEDDEKLTDYAHSSLAHWRKTGKEINLQRGFWLLSRVYTVLNQCEPAQKYAKRCLQVTLEYPDQMEDFDIAFSYEAVARSFSLAGENEEYQKNIRLAEEAGKSIKNESDREVFQNELQSGDWFGCE